MRILVALLIVTVLEAFSAVQAEPKHAALYMNQAGGVLDLSWDRSAMNLENQLRQLGLNVMLATTGQPKLDSSYAPNAYVIPAQNGYAYYSSAEDMRAVSSYLASGGLVIILDATHGHGEALSTFVAKAFDYQGKWIVCDQLYTNDDQVLGELQISKLSSAFIEVKTSAKGYWPDTLEDARTTSLYTSCLHEDLSASIVPLYFAQDSEFKVAAQAFSKVGVSGAIVWLGYNWKAGAQTQWGNLLRTLISDFKPNSDAVTVEMESYDVDAELLDAELEDPELLDSVLESVSDMSDPQHASEVLRRFLQDSPLGTYPPPSSLGQPRPPRPPRPPRQPHQSQPPPTSSLRPPLPSPQKLLPPSPSPPSPSPPSPHPPSPSPPSPITSPPPKINSPPPNVNSSPPISNRPPPPRVRIPPPPPPPRRPPPPPPPKAKPPPPKVSSPPSPPPKVSPLPSPPKFSPPSPVPKVSPPPPASDNYVIVNNFTAQGALGSDGLVFYGSPFFKQQLLPRSALQLVDPNKKPCPPPAKGLCSMCRWAWMATQTERSVALFFKDPTQISRINIKQIRNPGIIKVQFLKWVYPPQGVVEGNLMDTVYNFPSPAQTCQSVLSIRVTSAHSGIDLDVPDDGSAAELPASLAGTATGGVLITVIPFPQNAAANFGPFLEWVRFNGRVLYPSE